MDARIIMQTGGTVSVPIGAAPGGGADGVPNIVSAFQFSGLRILSNPMPLKIVLDASYPNPNPAAAPGGNYEAYAVVKWGGPKTSFQAEVDLGTSTAISVYGSSLVVDIAYRRTAADGLFPPPPFVNVNAQVVFGADSGASQAQRTVRFGTIANGGTSPTFDLPQYAKHVRVIGSDLAGAAGYVALFYAWGDVIAAIPAAPGAQLPIPNGANRLAIVNSTGAAQTIRAICDLYL